MVLAAGGMYAVGLWQHYHKPPLGVVLDTCYFPEGFPLKEYQLPMHVAARSIEKAF